MTSEQKADVLVVDDDEGVRDVLQRILEGGGHRVRTATDANDALRQIRASAPGVVVTDVHMPGPSGVWLAQQIGQEFAEIPVLLVTSDQSVPPSETMRNGVVGYLIKPFDHAHVLASVSQAYGWRKAAQSHGEVSPIMGPASPAASRMTAAAVHAAPAAPAPVQPAGDAASQHRRKPLLSWKLLAFIAVFMVVVVLAILLW